MGKQNLNKVLSFAKKITADSSFGASADVIYQEQYLYVMIYWISKRNTRFYLLNFLIPLQIL